jgi:hypothetical protein
MQSNFRLKKFIISIVKKLKKYFRLVYIKIKNKNFFRYIEELTNLF